MILLVDSASVRFTTRLLRVNHAAVWRRPWIYSSLLAVYTRLRVYIMRFRVQNMRFRVQNRRFLSCGRGESNSQGVVQAPHSLPRRARLPVSSRPRRVETHRGLVAAGLICRWLPPRVHSFNGVPGRSRTGFSRFAGQAADRSPSGTRPTSGQECNTAPGRSYVQALCNNFGDYAILAPTGLIFLIERLHVSVQTPLSAPPSETRTPSRQTDACWSLDRERQARPLQEAPQARLAQEKVLTKNAFPWEHHDSPKGTRRARARVRLRFYWPLCLLVP